MTKVRVINTDKGTFRVAQLGAIFVCSHMLDPEFIFISRSSIAIDDFGFHLEGDKIIEGREGEIPVSGAIEADWWENEECDFDSCAQSVQDFLALIMSEKAEYGIVLHDFTKCYPYYNIRGHMSKAYAERLKELGM